MRCKYCGQFIEDAVQIPNNKQQVSIQFPDNYVMGTLEICGERISVYLSKERAEQLGKVPERCGHLRGHSASKIVRVFEFVEA